MLPPSGHGERGVVGKNHANGTGVTGFQGVALEDRIAGLQCLLRAVCVRDRDRAGRALDLADGLTFAGALGELVGAFLGIFRESGFVDVSHSWSLQFQ